VSANEKEKESRHLKEKLASVFLSSGFCTRKGTAGTARDPYIRYGTNGVAFIQLHVYQREILIHQKLEWESYPEVRFKYKWSNH
jgi:hypothetical protein